MAAAAAVADAGAAVPTCPGWTVRDLIRHTGGVHRWATGFVADGRTEPSGRDSTRPWGQGRPTTTLRAGSDRGAPTSWPHWPRARRPAVLDVPGRPVAARHVGAPPGPRDRHPPRRCTAGGRPPRHRVRPGVRRRRHRRALGLVRPPPQRQAPRRPAGHPGGALHRRRRLVAVAHGRRRGDHDGPPSGRRPRAPPARSAGRPAISTWRCGTAPVRTSWPSRATRDVLGQFFEGVRIRWSADVEPVVSGRGLRRRPTSQ